MNARFHNLILLVRTHARALMRGRAARLVRDVKRIIVVPTGKLGDVVCTTPVLAAVRKHFPRAKIILYPDSPLHRELLAHSGLVDEFGSTSADVALVTGPTFDLAAKLYLAGVPFISAPEIIGDFSSQVTRPYRLLLKLLSAYRYRMGEYAPRERLRCLEPLGIIEDDTRKSLGFSPEALENAKHYLAGSFVAGITPTAGHKIKEWPEEKFAKVADYLIEKYGASVLLFGGPKDGEKVQKTMSFMKNKAMPVTNLSLDELKALISKLNLFISVDTGPIYIAEAFGVPTVDITGPIDENEQPPRGSIHRNVVPLQRAKPELFVLNAKTYNKEEARRQVDSITHEMVAKEIDALMADINK